jgi:hypothetical protein
MFCEQIVCHLDHAERTHPKFAQPLGLSTAPLDLLSSTYRLLGFGPSRKDGPSDPPDQRRDRNHYADDLSSPGPRWR